VTADAVAWCDGSYYSGCKCQACRDDHAQRARRRINRRANGVIGPGDAVQLQPTVDAIIRMRSSGLTWVQLGALTGVDKNALQRACGEGRKWVTLDFAERVEAAERVVVGKPEYAAAVAMNMVDAAFTRWMVHSLLARGWTSAWLGQQVGWGGTRLTPRDVRGARVYRTFEAKVRAVFDGYHHEQGPSRAAALKAWRNGWFPADCYDWEERDFRPIPGSLHPDVVRAAATFNLPSPGKLVNGKARGAEVLADMVGWGQWPSERCARTSMRNWAEATGNTFDDEYSDIYVQPGRSVWCRNLKHDHGLPVAWRPGPAINAQGTPGLSGGGEAG